MPASPSDKWRRGRRRAPKMTKRHRPDEDDEDDGDDEDDTPHHLNQHDNEDPDEDEDLHPNPNPNRSPPVKEAEVVSSTAVRISTFPPAVKYALTTRPLHSSLAPLENISHGQLQVLSAVPVDDSSVVITPPPILEGKGVLKTFWDAPLILPLHADWFQPTAVHRLERQVVPHFFSATAKSPQHTAANYLESRNLIVAKYLQNPHTRLSLSDLLPPPFPLDPQDLSRIFRFLDHWGIINYSAPPPPYLISTWNPHSYLREDPNGEVHVPSPTLNSIDSLIAFDKPKCRLNPTEFHSSDHDHLADLDSKIRERLSESQCHYCSRPILILYYQSVKEADTVLCPDCYHEGRFVVGHSSMDFIKVDSAVEYADQDGDNWTDQETLLLLEAVELYSDNWNDIADHVGSKSKSQCILQFLRLPMEDGLLENFEVPTSCTPSNGSNNADHGSGNVTANGVSSGPPFQDSDFENKFPFANSGNPVMTLVAFLASALGPRIAAACAHACLASLSEDELSLQGNRANSDESSVETRNFGQQKGETLAAEGSQVPNDVTAEDSLLPAEKVKSAAKVGLGAAALKAKLFADHEEREIQRLSANIINHQLKRLELKLKQFAEVETLLMKECEQVEKTRQRLAGERSRAIAGRFGPSGVGPSMSLPGVTHQVMSNNMSNSGPPTLSASPSQPSVSGYASQMIHPQMPFLPRQQMFNFGPRLPLSAIHPPSGPSSSMMFSGQGSSHSPLSRPVLRPVPGTSSGMG